MQAKLIRTPGLYLVGFMGSGKTTVGRRVAGELGWPFADLDGDIESGTGQAITAIFEALGEAEFRRLETAALERRVRSVQYGHPLILALGGGAFTQPGNLELIRSGGVSIWLDCPLDRIRERIQGQSHRPLAHDPARFEQLFHTRTAAYASADYRIQILSDDPEEAAGAIVALPLFQ